MNDNTIIVEVEGGVVTTAYRRWDPGHCLLDSEVVVRDWDNIKKGDADPLADDVANEGGSARE
jgi:hypothetical protein